MRGLCQGHLGSSRRDPGEGEGYGGRGWIQGERRPPRPQLLCPRRQNLPPREIHSRGLASTFPPVFKRCKLSSEEHVLVSLTFAGPGVEREEEGSLGVWGPGGSVRGSGQSCWGRARRAHPGSDAHGCTRLPCPQAGWGHLAREGPMMLCSDPTPQILPTPVSRKPHVRDLRVRVGVGWVGGLCPVLPARGPPSSGTDARWPRPSHLLGQVCLPAALRAALPVETI